MSLVCFCFAEGCLYIIYHAFIASQNDGCCLAGFFSGEEKNALMAVIKVQPSLGWINVYSSIFTHYYTFWSVLGILEFVWPPNPPKIWLSSWPDFTGIRRGCLKNLKVCRLEMQWRQLQSSATREDTWQGSMSHQYSVSSWVLWYILNSFMHGESKTSISPHQVFVWASSFIFLNYCSLDNAIFAW